MEHPLLVDHLVLSGIAGTNKVMAGEMSRLSKRAIRNWWLPDPQKDGLGGLVYPFSPALAALAVRYHRTSSRVLWGIWRSTAARLEPLYDDLRLAMRQETRPWLRDGMSFSVSPAATREFAAGGRQLVGVVKNALIDGAAERGMKLTVDADDPDVWFLVKAADGVVSVAIDLGGQAMNQRGYRVEGGGTAPLRENLAAVMVMLARHDPRGEVVVDPMAGSGTLAIEAASLAQGRPVWIPPRAPAAARLPPVAAALEAAAPDPLFADTRPLAFANEIDPKAHAAARRNVERAGVSEFVEASCGDFVQLDPKKIMNMAAARGFDPERGLILCNPPYGERLEPKALVRTYRDLGIWYRQFPGWRAAFLVANPEFVGAFGGRPRIEKPLNNGPIKSWFFLYEP